MQTFQVTIRGTSALLQNRVENFDAKPAGEGNEDQRAQAKERAHLLPDGRFYLPGTALCGVLKEAAEGQRIPGSRKSAASLVRGAAFVTEDAVVLLAEDGKTPVADFEVDSRAVLRAGHCLLLHRPRFDNWSATFTLNINEAVLPPDFVQKLLAKGGERIGVGDYRPTKGGNFGKFSVTAWKPLEKLQQF